MGLEAQCTVRVGRKTSLGSAQLEGENLVFRGDFQLNIPFERMREVSVDGDTLVVAADDEVRLELGGPVAVRWMKLIKQPRGLFEKLELGPQSRVAVVDVNDSLFVTALRERTANVAEGRVPEGAATILFGVEARDALRRLPLLRARIVDSGVIWVIRPKASKSIAEEDLLEAAREAGLAEVKSVAFSRTHTAHKLAVPVEMRGQIRRRPPILTIPPSAPALGATMGSPALPQRSRSLIVREAKTEKSRTRARARPLASKKKSRSKPKKPAKRR
jgi:hypothetical protein